MKAAILEVDTAMLVKALGIPDDTHIRDVQMSFDVQGRICFVIYHKSLPSIRPGETLLRVNAQFKNGEFFAYV